MIPEGVGATTRTTRARGHRLHSNPQQSPSCNAVRHLSFPGRLKTGTHAHRHIGTENLRAVRMLTLIDVPSG